MRHIYLNPLRTRDPDLNSHILSQRKSPDDVRSLLFLKIKLILLLMFLFKHIITQCLLQEFQRVIEGDYTEN